MAGFAEKLNCKKVKIIAVVGLVLLIVGIIAAIFVGKFLNQDTPDAQTGDSTYTVTVLSKAGKPLQGISVSIYTNESKEEMVGFEKTDADGKISFTNKTGTYVACLENLPVGYAAEQFYSINATEVTVVLGIKTMTEEDMGITYKLGDAMMDFAVTTTEGTQYTISKLLESKKSVVLSFWSMNASSCGEVLPCLQESYGNYSDKLEVLALNPVDKDAAAIESFCQDLGLTIPVAQVDARWEKIMSITGYPTMVVVDRFGNICFIHSDTINSAKTFEDVFAFFTAEDYEQKFVSDISEISSTEEVYGTAANPYEFGGVTEFEVTVEPGQTVYCNVYRVSGMLLQTQEDHVYIIYEDATYKPENGLISIPVTSADTYTPTRLQIGNSGSEKKTFKIMFIAPEGTLNNPHTMEMGSFTVNVEAGNEQGVYYTYTASQNGVLTLQCIKSTDGVDFGYSLYNLTTYAYRTLDSDGVKDETTGVVTLSVEVHAGDVIQFSAGTLPDTANQYPAAELEFKASFEEKTGSDDDNPSGGTTEQKITYTVKVTDDSNKPIAGVVVTFSGSSNTNVTTNASGIASTTLTEGSYNVTVKSPAGYLEHSATYSLTKDITSVTIRLVNPATSDNYTELYVGYAMHVNTGTTKVNLVPGELTYFLFTPTKAGKYQFTASSAISYWGTNTNFIMDHTSSTNLANNKFSVSIKEGNIGGSYIIAVTAPAGVSSGTVTITRIGEPDLDISDAPWETYKGTHKPKDYTFPGGNLVYVDVTGASQDYKIVLGSDGYYHLGSAAGPIMYVNLGADAPYLSVAEILKTSPIRKIFKYSDGSFKKVDYTECVSGYVDCMDANKGVYPLTEDLKIVLQEYGQSEGWWSTGNTGYYLFDSVSGLNVEIAWMFACCYIA